MPHLDEGQLHALLDGELTPTERAEAEAHLASCAACRAAQAEAVEFLAEADKLIGTIEVPPAEGRRQMLPKTRVHTMRWTRLAWAATVVLAVGLGWFASSARQARAPVGATDLAETPVTAPAASTMADSQLRAKAAPAPAAEAAPMKEEKRAAPMVARERAEPLAADEPAQPAAPLAQAPAEQDRPAPAAKAAESTGLAAGNVDAASRDALQRSYAPAPAPAARIAAQAASTLRPVPMEEAVRILGGSIRLVDGMAPLRVLAGTLMLDSGTSGVGVRVVYDDPPGRELWLDQVRPDATGNEAPESRGEATTLLPGDTVAIPMNHGARGLRWLDQSGFRLGLTGFLPADSLRALARRVQ